MFQQDRPVQQQEDPADTAQSVGLEGLATGLEQTFQEILQDEKIDSAELSALSEMHAEQMVDQQLSDLMESLDTNGDGVISMDEMRAGATKENLSRMVQEGMITEEMASSMEELARHHRVHGVKGAHGPGEGPEEATGPSVEEGLEPDAELAAETGLENGTALDQATAEPSMEDILAAMGAKQEQAQPEALQSAETEVEAEQEPASMEDILKTLQEQGTETEPLQNQQGLANEEATALEELTSQLEEPTAEVEAQPITKAQQATMEALAQERDALLKEMGIELETEAEPTAQPAEEQELVQADLVERAKQYLEPELQVEEQLEPQPLTQDNEEFVIGATESIAQDITPEEELAQAEELTRQMEESIAPEDGGRFDSELSALSEERPKVMPVFKTAEPEVAQTLEQDLDFEGIFERKEAAPAIAANIEPEEPTVGVSGVQFKDGQIIISLKAAV